MYGASDSFLVRQVRSDSYASPSDTTLKLLSALFCTALSVSFSNWLEEPNRRPANQQHTWIWNNRKISFCDVIDNHQ